MLVSVTGTRKKRREEDGTARKARTCAMEGKRLLVDSVGCSAFGRRKATTQKMKGKLE